MGWVILTFGEFLILSATAVEIAKNISKVKNIASTTIKKVLLMNLTSSYSRRS